MANEPNHAHLELIGSRKYAGEKWYASTHFGGLVINFGSLTLQQ